MDQGNVQALDGQEEHSTHSEQQSGKTSTSDVLYELYDNLKDTVSDKPTAKELADLAQNVIDGLNKKRQNDMQLLEEYRQAIEGHAQKMASQMKEQLFQLHEVRNEEVNAGLHRLFARIDNIAASQQDLNKFKASLRDLYEDMHAQN